MKRPRPRHQPSELAIKILAVLNLAGYPMVMASIARAYKVERKHVEATLHRMKADGTVMQTSDGWKPAKASEVGAA